MSPEILWVFNAAACLDGGILRCERRVWHCVQGALYVFVKSRFFEDLAPTEHY